MITELQTELREVFHPPMQETIFATPVGGVGEVIDFRDALWVLKVHASIPGKAEAFEDPGVREVAGALFAEKRRKDWEKNYLERLAKRIEEERAGEPAEAKDAK